MGNSELNLLLRQAVKLTALGMNVERKRSLLYKLVERGIAYIAPEMIAAVEQFEKADDEWNRLEAEHLALRIRLGIEDRDII